LQQLGYQRIAQRGLVPLKTAPILECLDANDYVRDPGTELHLLGITRIASMDEFASHGVTSFDSTSAFRQSFMDDRNNYHTPTETFTAIRVPQADGNPALKRRILSGVVSQSLVKAAERECLKRLRGYDRDPGLLDKVIDILGEYEQLVVPEKKSRLAAYQRTLEAAPWKTCECTLCRKCGIDIIIFRGTERNKSRGFHNLAIFNHKVRNIVQSSAPEN
jgi:hypothetical protein